MDKEIFEEIIAEFFEKLDGLEVLVKELRDTLFSYREGLFTGTYRDSNRLYKPMIDAFERAIAKYVEG